MTIFLEYNDRTKEQEMTMYCWLRLNTFDLNRTSTSETNLFFQNLFPHFKPV
jgi:hypothetical protein